MLHRIDQLLRQVSHLGFLAASALLLIVGLIGAVDIVSTNLLFLPIPGMVELSGALLAMIVFLGLAEAQARGLNIVIDVATQHMTGFAKRASAAFSLTIGLVVMALIAWTTTRLAISAWQLHEVALGALPFPLAPFKTAAAFGAWLATAEFGRQLLRCVSGHEASEVGRDG